MNYPMNDHVSSTSKMDAICLTDIPVVGRVHDYITMKKVPVPQPNSQEVLVKLCASAMHIDEIYAAQGTALGRFYGPRAISDEKPCILGSSVSGVVVKVGSGVKKIKIGDEVIAIPSEQMERGSWANYRVLDQKMVMRKPDKLTPVEAAATTMGACVAWGSIQAAKVRRGADCVVVGASGAIGSMIVQYLKSLDCHITAVCGAKNERYVRQLGAHEVVDYTLNDFADLAEYNAIRYDIVFDCVGGKSIEKSAFRVLKNDGVFETIVGPMQYVGEEKLSWSEFASVLGYVGKRMLSTRIRRGPMYTFGEKYPKNVIEQAYKVLLNENIKMPIDRVIPFTQQSISEAIRHLTTHRAKGRIVINFESSLDSGVFVVC